MSNQSNPKQAQPGKGAAGDQWAVQTAQTTAVNMPDTKVPTDADVEKNKAQVEAEAKAEAEPDLHTTDGYVVDEAGRLDNFAVEPQPYVEEK